MGYRYYVTINTDAYKPMRCSKKNWENGTINSQMKALNGWQSTEHNIMEVRWRIEMFLRGYVFVYGDSALVEKLEKWKSQPNNTIAYRDEPCGVDRTMRPECPPWHQGYYKIEKVLETLRKDGIVRIPFSAAYDSRQYRKNMDGCYMEIILKK